MGFDISLKITIFDNKGQNWFTDFEWSNQDHVGLLINLSQNTDYLNIKARCGHDQIQVKLYMYMMDICGNVTCQNLGQTIEHEDENRFNADKVFRKNLPKYIFLYGHNSWADKINICQCMFNNFIASNKTFHKIKQSCTCT